MWTAGVLYNVLHLLNIPIHVQEVRNIDVLALKGSFNDSDKYRNRGQDHRMTWCS